MSKWLFVAAFVQAPHLNAALRFLYASVWKNYGTLKDDFLMFLTYCLVSYFTFVFLIGLIVFDDIYGWRWAKIITAVWPDLGVL